MANLLTDDLMTEIERQLQTALEVCIAAAFINFEGIRLLKKYLESVSNKRSITINFLLDKDFHPNSAARQVIINELYSIPGTNVRIFNDEDKKMHMKVYIFSNGNTCNVIAGSHNPTGAGFIKNIEASLLTTDKEVIREARVYFNKFWSLAQKAFPVENIFYSEPKFKAGDIVIHKGTQRIGTIVNHPSAELREKEWYYFVLWTDNNMFEPSECPEKSLRPVITIVDPDLVSIFNRFCSKNVDELSYFQEMLRKKMTTPIQNGLFSYLSSRTDILPYQFKPLLKFMSSQRQRILIADEVGLGKTIEAGIIFSELKARNERFGRVLVVCPTNLKIKWKNEMESRFDEYFQILNSKDFYRMIDNTCNGYGIISYDLLARDEMIEHLKDSKPNWDLLILDEAHHLRNVNKRHKAVVQMTKYSNAVVMLTATPINIQFGDLINLFKVLLPHFYRDIDDTEFAHRAEPNRFLFQASEEVEYDCKKALDILKQMEHNCKYGPKIAKEEKYKIVKTLLENTDTLSNAQLIEIRDVLSDLNTFSNIVSRTRKEEVSKVITRDIVTVNVEYTEIEKYFYNEIVGIVQLLASKLGKRGGLSVMMPQRQAASCLPAAIEYLKTTLAEKEISGREIAGEFLNNELHENTVKIDLVLLEKIKSIVDKYESRKDVFSDSKYSKLKQFLSEKAFTNGRLDKVILFTSFRKTLTYLQYHLEKDFGYGVTIEIHGDIKPMAERDNRIRRFQSPMGPSILLCTEIGSEGLDMQFANKMVNYDLPWNPMRVEQRIGRIDRYGQKADKILILNFAISGTIEDNVMTRLIERIKLFKNALGPLNEVVGKIVQKLCDDLLNKNLSELERVERIRKYELSIENAAMQENKFTEQRNNLIGQDKNFSEEVRNIEKNRQYITDSELFRVLEVFNRQNSSDTSIEKIADDQYQFIITGSSQKKLLQSIQKLSNIHSTKKQLFHQKLSEGKMLFTVKREEAIKNKSIEFFSLHHPVISAIIRQWEPKSLCALGCFRGSVQNVEPGKYILFTFYCEYKFEDSEMRTSVDLYHSLVSLGRGERDENGEMVYNSIMCKELLWDNENIPEFFIENFKNSFIIAQRHVTELVNETVKKIQIEWKENLKQENEAKRIGCLKQIEQLTVQRNNERDNRRREDFRKKIDEIKMNIENFNISFDQMPDIVARPVLSGCTLCQIN